MDNEPERKKSVEIEEALPPEVVEALNKRSISDDLRIFIDGIDSLASTLPLTMFLVGAEQKRSHEELQKTFAEKLTKHSDDKIYARYENVTPDNYKYFQKLLKRASKADLAAGIVPRSYHVSLISQFDAFLGTLIKTIYYLRPEKLNASAKQFTFAELLKIGSIEAAREEIIEKEVDAVMRESHTRQIEWLSKFSEIDLKKEINAWSAFIEITERRNLFVHTGGVVSKQYLEICRDNKADVGAARLGDRLGVSPKYF